MHDLFYCSGQYNIEKKVEEICKDLLNTPGFKEFYLKQKNAFNVLLGKYAPTFHETIDPYGPFPN